jgi:DNA-binding CsgD family transcriptional regulator/tetratricopeptide (TPR) repeat protein
MIIRGRQAERDRLACLVTAARDGDGGMLVVSGEPGIGKTTLLDEVAATPEIAVLRSSGVAAEEELPFAGLHHLLGPLLDDIDRLPAPQAAALRGAFGLAEGQPDRFHVALAALTLLSDAARKRPVLIAIDDAQWLDAASVETLVFLGRRLGGKPIALLVAMRNTDPDRMLGCRLPQLVVGPLRSDQARELLDQDTTLAADLRERVLTEAAGNPLALRELPAALTSEELNGTVPLPARIRLSRRLRDALLWRVDRLDRPARTILVVAAAEITGDLNVVLRAAQRLGVAHADLASAAGSGLLASGHGRDLFVHPLARSAMYQSAGFDELRAAHRALADVLPPNCSQGVLHQAFGVAGPDDRIAKDLADAALHAKNEGDLDTAAQTFERAAELATNPAAHLIDAGECAWLAGYGQRTFAFLDRAERLADNPLLRGRIARVRGAILYSTGDVRASCQILRDAASSVGDTDPVLGGELLVMAARAAWTAGDTEALGAIGQRIVRLRLSEEDPAVQLGIWLAWLGKSGGSLLSRIADRALLAWLDKDDPEPWVWPPNSFLFFGSQPLSSRETWHRTVRKLRASGATGQLPVSVQSLVTLDILTGRWDNAIVDGADALRIAEETGQFSAVSHLNASLAWVAALRGQDQECQDRAQKAIRIAVTHGLSSPAAAAHWALGMLALGHGEAEEAVRWFTKATVDDLSGVLALVDLAEALVRLRLTQQAQRALSRFAELGASHGVSRCETITLRCRALIANDPSSSALFEAALRADAPSTFETARTHLLYGEWLRRARRIESARYHLTTARDRFELLGATPWMSRAQQEIRATGKTMPVDLPTQRTALDKLTPRERQVVQLAAQGLTNREIAERLYLSHRTIGDHLSKLYPKLGVASRRQLRDLV